MSATRGAVADAAAGVDPDAVAGVEPDAVLRALADPHRRQMLRLVRGGELASGEVAGHFAMTQQAVSHHLHVLRRAGLVRERRDGTRHLFSLQPEALDSVRDVLTDLWPDALSRLKRAVESNRTAAAEAQSK